MARYHRTKYHRLWRKRVRKRCKNKCDITGEKKKLYAHHLNDVSNHWKQRKHVKNGVMIVKRLHKIFHCDYMGGYRVKCTKEDYETFKLDYLANPEKYEKL